MSNSAAANQGGNVGGSYENRSYNTMTYHGSNSRTDTLEETVMTTKAEVFIKEDGIDLKQPNFTREEVQDWVNRILDWVHGPGTKLLESQRDLPRNFEEAERIRKNHEQFEFKCMKALATYAKLRDIRSDDNEIAEYIEKLEITIQDFLRRLQNRRQTVVSLYTFFRLQQELETYFSEIGNILRRESHLRIEDTEHYLKEVERVLRYAENLYQQIFLENERIKVIVVSQEILTIVANYLADIKQRLGKQLEHLKIRSLETKKYLQLLVYDRDAKQTVTWLDDIIRIVIETYLKYNIGKTPMETQQLLQQYRTMEAKSQETYDYGKELITSLAKMYTDQNKPTNVCSEMKTNLDINQRRLKDILVEVGDRYTAADAFYENVDLNLERIERLILLICRDLDTGITLEDVRKTYASERNEIIRAYESTKKIGVGLMERIKHAVANLPETVDQSMIDEVTDVIKVKLFTLWLKIRELYYYLGQVIEITEITERWQVIRISIDKFYERMLFWEAKWQEGQLPFTIREAEYLIGEHQKAKEEIRNLWQDVDMDLQKIVRDGDSVEVAKMAEKAAIDASKKKQEWMQRWDRHMDILDMRHKLLLRLRDLDLEVDDLCGRLKKLEARPVDEAGVVDETVAEVGQLSDVVPEVREKMQTLFKETRERVRQDFERHIDPIEVKWQNFVKELELFQMFVDTILRMLKYIDKLYSFIEELNVQLPQCRGREEAEPWFQKIQGYNKTTASFDCDWLVNVATRLYGNAEKPRPVIEKLRLIGAKLKVFETSITEMVTVESVTLVRSVRKERKFFRELADLTLTEGDTCSLEVEYSTPDGTGEVEWQRNGRPLPTSNIGGKWVLDDQEGFTSVSCDSAAVEDAGSFSCVIRDSTGVMETLCRLRVLSPPQFTMELQPVRVNQDEPILLQCKVKGSPNPDVQWYKDNQPLRRNFDYDIENVDGICALKVARVDGSHAGLYRCKAVNQAGEASTSAHVEVKEFTKCKFTRSISDQDCREGERLRLHVEFEGDPQPEVTWFRDNQRISANSPRTSIQTGGSYSTCTIDPLEPEDEGLYSVQIRNPTGVQKSVCSVNVRPLGEAPKYLSPLMDETVTEGSQLRLTCRISGKPTPEVTWYFNNRPITRHTRRGVQLLSDSETGQHSLEIDDAKPEDEGEYRVVAENRDGRVETKCRVSVEPPSEEEEQPVPFAPRFSGDISEELVAHVSDKVTLQCTVHGHPLPTVTWHKDGLRIYTDEHVIVSGFDEQHSLVIPYVRPEDAGVYKIVASNEMGSAECRCNLRVIDEDYVDKRTTLVFHNTVVKAPPEFVRLFRDEFCKVGDDVILECEIGGIPDPTVWWSFNGQPITDRDYRFRTTSNERVHSLYIKRVSMSETGRYSLTAENSSGVATCSSLLIVEEQGKTGSYEHTARLASQATNSRSLSSPPIHFTPSAAHLSQLASHQSESLHSVDVTPHFELHETRSQQLKHDQQQLQQQRQQSTSSSSNVYRVESHSVDYAIGAGSLDTTDSVLRQRPSPSGGAFKTVVREEVRREERREISSPSGITQSAQRPTPPPPPMPSKPKPQESSTSDLANEMEALLKKAQAKRRDSSQQPQSPARQQQQQRKTAGYLSQFEELASTDFS